MSTVSADAATMRFKGWEIRPTERVLLVRGEPVHLGSRTFDLLLALVQRQGRIATKRELLDCVWPGLVVEENNLSVQIAALRKLIGAQAIATVTALGYRLSAEPDSPRSGDETPAASCQELPVPAARTNLPSTMQPLFGRDADVATLRALVASHRVVTIVGPGGIGKTRLAQAVARSADKASFSDGTWLVELAPVSDGALLPAAVAQALGLRLSDLQPARAQLTDMLKHSAMLLVLDNCEHLVDAAAGFVSSLVDGSDRIRVLATSQAPLRVPGEQLFHVTPLTLPSNDDLASAWASAAVALLATRVSALQPDFALTSVNVADAAEICRCLDGLPLAIELAAARVPLLGLTGVRERLPERFRMLTQGRNTAQPRQQTLLRTLEWSHALLGPTEQAILRRLSVFAGGFGLDLARLALEDDELDEWGVLEGLGALVERSLLVVEPTEPRRYRLLESTRAFALDRLVDSGERDRLLHRHARAVLSVFEKSYAERWTLTSPERVQRYLPDIDNCRAALDWSWSSDTDLHIALAGASAWLWNASGQGAEGMRHCEQARARLGPATPPAVEAALQYGWCELAHYTADPGKRVAAERAVTIYRERGDTPRLYAALARLAISCSLAGDGTAGERAVHEMAGLFDDSWPTLARWDLINARDYVANMLGRLEEGEALAREGMALATSTGDTSKALFAMMALEQCASTRGHFAEAVARGRELVALARQQRFVERMQVYVGNLATSLIRMGEIDEALTTSREAAVLCSRVGTLWQNLDALSLLACKRGRHRDAAVVIGRAEAANAWRQAFREPVEQQIRDDVIRLLRDELPLAEFEALLARGATLTDSEAANLALAD